jgi:hypothetical protein
MIFWMVVKEEEHSIHPWLTELLFWLPVGCAVQAVSMGWPAGWRETMYVTGRGDGGYLNGSNMIECR